MRNYYAVSLILLLFSCGKQPGKVVMEQLTETPYYEEGVEQGEATKVRLKYKPYMYFYSGKPYTGKVYSNYADGSKKLTGSMKNGFPDGSWVYYHENGKVENKAHYQEGTPDSLWQKYFKDGNKSVTEKYYMTGRMLHCDTIEAWYDWKKKKIETIGDTIKSYFYSGSIASLTIGNRLQQQWTYTKDGMPVSRTTNYKREMFDTKGGVFKRIYYLHVPEGREAYKNAKEVTTKEQREAIEKADSVEFDFTYKWDPVVRIYMGH